MGIKVYKPTSPGRRNMSVSTFEEITKATPEKTLTTPVKKNAGRNVRGKVTVRHRGGGSKRLYRAIDFKRDKEGIPARVHSIEYDPNRSARIALLFYADGEKRYIVAPQGLKVDDTVMSGPQAEVRPGNTLPLANIPVGTLIHNIEFERGRGGQIARAAGAAAQLMAKDGLYAMLRLPSGEVRRIRVECHATIGQVGNLDHANVRLGTAGRKRHMGRRPEVRGTAMSPRDHPHGGGEGRQPIGMPGPKTPWGKPARGYKTRRNKVSENFIVHGRPSKKKQK